MGLPILARLTLASAVLMTAVIACLGAFLYVRLEADLYRAVDDRLAERAALIDGTGTGGPLLARPTSAEPTDEFAQVLSSSGEVLESTPLLGGAPLLPPEALTDLRAGQAFKATVHTVEEPIPARLLATVLADGRVVVVAASVEDQDDALRGLRDLLFAGSPVAVVLATIVGWQVGRTALRPVERLRVEAEAISGLELGRRLAVPSTGDELSRLAASFNRLLERQEGAIGRERRLIDDASHELRTPLANVRAELELGLREGRSPSEVRHALQSAAQETERLIRLADDLLVLARADRGLLELRREAVDVAAVVRDVVAGFSARASMDGVAIRVAGLDRAMASADETRLRQAIGNLVDNGLRYAGRGGHVTVRVHDAGDGVRVEVADSGPGFRPELVAQAFEPFSRADPARGRAEGGAGLGLAIVHAVARSHGGSVDARNAPGGGAIVELRLPG